MQLNFRPRLLDSLHGYDRQRFTGDLGAGLTVAVVALPLAMAFAIGSGLPPEAGLFTTIIAGFLIAVLGGSRVQIGGPAGAFIVIVYGIVHDHGVAGLIVATLMSGVLLFAMGLLRLGTLVHFIPMSVIIGFTNGIAVLIGLSQLKDFLGLQVSDMPADFFGIAAALWAHKSTLNPWAFGLAVLCFVLLMLWQRVTSAVAQRIPRLHWLARVPGSIVVLVLATVAVAAMHLPVETITDRFGGIPGALPALQLPEVGWETARPLLMPAITLALLGAIESLLCARVADGLIGDRHDPNQELMAQGIANFAASLFGGMPATGTIARTVTNVEAGATSPVAGIIHAVVLLAVVLVAAPLAGSIPLAALAAILMHVAWNMGQWRAFAKLRRMTVPYGATLLLVFFLTVVFDLVVAVQVGILAACITFLWRMSSLTRAHPLELAGTALANAGNAAAAWRIHGVLFFGATQLAHILEDSMPSRALVLDFDNVLYMDSTGASALSDLIQTCNAQGVRVVASGLSGQPLDMARRSGLLRILEPHLQASLDRALDAAAELVRRTPEPQDRTASS